MEPGRGGCHVDVRTLACGFLVDNEYLLASVCSWSSGRCFSCHCAPQTIVSVGEHLCTFTTWCVSEVKIVHASSCVSLCVCVCLCVWSERIYIKCFQIIFTLLYRVLRGFWLLEGSLNPDVLLLLLLSLPVYCARVVATAVTATRYAPNTCTQVSPKATLPAHKKCRLLKEMHDLFHQKGRINHTLHWFFVYTLLSLLGNLGRLNWVRLQHPQEQRYPVLPFHVSVIHRSLTWTIGF